MSFKRRTFSEWLELLARFGIEHFLVPTGILVVILAMAALDVGLWGFIDPPIWTWVCLSLTILLGAGGLLMFFGKCMRTDERLLSRIRDRNPWVAQALKAYGIGYRIFGCASYLSLVMLIAVLAVWYFTEDATSKTDLMTYTAWFSIALVVSLAVVLLCVVLWILTPESTSDNDAETAQENSC